MENTRPGDTWDDAPNKTLPKGILNAYKTLGCLIVVGITSLAFFSGCIPGITPENMELNKKLNEAGIENKVEITSTDYSVDVKLQDFEPDAIATVMNFLSERDDSLEMQYYIHSGRIESSIAGQQKNKIEALFFGAEVDDVENVNNFAKAVNATGDAVYSAHFREEDPDRIEESPNPIFRTESSGIVLQNNATAEDFIAAYGKDSKDEVEGVKYDLRIYTQDQSLTFLDFSATDQPQEVSEYIESVFRFREKLANVGLPETDISVFGDNKSILLSEPSGALITEEKSRLLIQEAFKSSGFPSSWEISGSK